MKAFKILITAALLLGITVWSYALIHEADECYGKCTGSKTCTACKNCSGCAHCHTNGGTCGVCR